ncbi:hypothetical protein [Spirulina sp. 06S082]|uniref:hypothetical protein n=1 Tax=Spirulina sp. 06S082 TaxID=3110248 RepID=UPI002B20B371|nr:hypothetical protein [Spirulina sp. 06S082]MEA5467514.1 hypothetical protein [Spirulina sp. 06S082]
MTLTLEEIAIAFRNCNSDTQFSFKDKLKKLDKSQKDYESGFIISDLHNYILHDIEKLLSKAILNICAADYLIKQGYFSWGFVTSYYANFFLIQGLNRTQLNFTTWVDRSVNCRYEDYLKQTIHIKIVERSKDEHQRQFQRFFDNFTDFRNKTGIDRYWNLGLRSFELSSEPKIRNQINYEISLDSFYELNLNQKDFKKIIKENKGSPFDQPKESTRKTNYARQNLKLALARLRILTYILNVIAIRNLEYQSYYERNMSNRLESLLDKYPDLSQWIEVFFKMWLFFDSELVESDSIDKI